MDILALLAFGILGLSLFFGIIFGLIRGAKKSFVRLIIVVAVFVVSLIFTPLIFKLTANIALPFVEGMFIEQLGESGKAILYDNMDFSVKLVGIFINPLLFMIIFIVLNLISLLVYFILSATVARRKTGKDGNPEPKKRLLGLLLGAAVGVVFTFAYMMPVNGYLSVVAALKDVELDNKPLIDTAQIEDMIPMDVSLDFDAYDKSFAANITGLFGLGNVCFDSLASASFTSSGETTKVVLRKETVVLADFMDKLGKVEFDKMLENVGGLADLLESAAKSDLIVAVLGLASENPELLDEFLKGDGTEGGSDVTKLAKAEEGGSESTMPDQTELIHLLLEGLRGDVKNQLAGCVKVFKTVASLEGFDFSNLDIDMFTNLSENDINRLVDDICDSAPVRNIFAFMMPDIIQPMAESMGAASTIDKPTVTDWNAEKTALKGIFKEIKLFTDLTDLSGSIDDIEGFFSKDKAVRLGKLMNSIRDSQLIKGLYNAITEYDESKNNYYIVSFLDDLVFGTEQPAAREVFSLNSDTGSTSRSTMKGLFVQTNAVKVNPANPNDTIDFGKFNWETLFGELSNALSFYKVAKDLGNIADIASSESRDEILDAMRSLDGTNAADTIKTVLDAMVGDSSVTLPDLTGVDFNKEADIMEKLFEYEDTKSQDKTEAEVIECLDLLNESKLITTMADSAGTVIEVTEDTKNTIKNVLDNDTEGKYTTEQKDLYYKLFGLDNTTSE